MIVLLGDVHGATQVAMPIVAKAKGYAPGAVPVLQVGDLGWHPDRPLRTPPWPIHFVEGNWDHIPSLLSHTEPTEVAPNWIYCPRGSVLRIDGRTVGFFGGARSIDRGVREEGVSWWPEEEPTREEAERLMGREDIDLLVTHSPPASVIAAMDTAPTEGERTSGIVEDLWRSLGRPSLVCGHMHHRFRLGNVLVLGELDADTV